MALTNYVFIVKMTDVVARESKINMWIIFDFSLEFSRIQNPEMFKFFFYIAICIDNNRNELRKIPINDNFKFKTNNKVLSH